RMSRSSLRDRDVTIGAELRRRDERRQARGTFRELGSGQHGDDAGNAERSGAVDSLDPRVSMRAADDRGVQHPGEAQIVDVPATAGQQPAIFLALDGGPERRGHGCCGSISGVRQSGALEVVMKYRPVEGWGRLPEGWSF